jgi:hypothetical protein
MKKRQITVSGRRLFNLTTIMTVMEGGARGVGVSCVRKVGDGRTVKDRREGKRRHRDEELRRDECKIRRKMAF